MESYVGKSTEDAIFKVLGKDRDAGIDTVGLSGEHGQHAAGIGLIIRLPEDLVLCNDDRIGTDYQRCLIGGPFQIIESRLGLGFGQRAADLLGFLIHGRCRVDSNGGECVA